MARATFILGHCERVLIGVWTHEPAMPAFGGKADIGRRTAYAERYVHWLNPKKKKAA
jgi:hypothetical protein